MDAKGDHMKRHLYGTTALVVAGLVASESQAASGLKLGITGFYRNSIGGSFGNSPTTRCSGRARRRRRGVPVIARKLR